MKGILALVSAIFMLVNISSCAENKAAQIPEPFSKSSFIRETEAENENEYLSIEHSVFYNPDYTADEVFAYFKEVVLSSEYTENVENSGLVQKWILPIYYIIEGDHSDEDKRIITDFINELNQIDGFPGMYPVENGKRPNFVMNFMSSGELMQKMGSAVNFEWSDGISQFWFLLRVNVICRAQIGYDKSMSNAVRPAVLLEEIVNAIGVSNDTETRKDSVVYSEYTETDHLSEMDWLILRILYSDQIKCGMNEDECYAAIKSIYY